MYPRTPASSFIRCHKQTKMWNINLISTFWRRTQVSSLFHSFGVQTQSTEQTVHDCQGSLQASFSLDYRWSPHKLKSPAGQSETNVVWDTLPPNRDTVYDTAALCPTSTSFFFFESRFFSPYEHQVPFEKITFLKPWHRDMVNPSSHIRKVFCILGTH
jgi:hypothetical protein